MKHYNFVTPKKIGTEPIIFNGKNTNYSLLDFWQWSTSDLISNTLRGRLAEFIVATAIGLDPNMVREEWANFDLETDTGIKIEVKSAAYIQSWQQKSPTKISFAVKPTYGWDSKLLKRDSKKKHQADVYVFCLLKTIDRLKINPLNLDEWEFYILSANEIKKLSGNHISLKQITSLTKGVLYDEIKYRIINKF